MEGWSRHISRGLEIILEKTISATIRMFTEIPQVNFKCHITQGF